jgi:hypothetical protein
MNIALFGNPFVDTGLGVIAALGGLDDVTALTLAKVREVFGDESQLAPGAVGVPRLPQLPGMLEPMGV